jgi:hypothetical protein
MLPSRDVIDWNLLSDDAQLRVAREAMRRAVETIASHAEMLASEMEAGAIADLGGPEALRLLATMVRLHDRDPTITAGTA